ncbi:hypothetical protein OAT18_02765 [Tenacibaculum sp.]|nr:hypothetical protein [Tenacibaculum sp.]
MSIQSIPLPVEDNIWPEVPISLLISSSVLFNSKFPLMEVLLFICSPPVAVIVVAPPLFIVVAPNVFIEKTLMLLKLNVLLPPFKVLGPVSVPLVL